MIPQNWLKDYYERADEENHSTENLTVNEYGFCSWIIQEDAVLIIDCYGDGKYWQSKMEEIARENGLTKTRAATKRNPMPYERKYGYKVIGFLMEKEL